jgi:hypothetical protein
MYRRAAARGMFCFFHFYECAAALRLITMTITGVLLIMCFLPQRGRTLVDRINQKKPQSCRAAKQKDQRQITTNEWNCKPRQAKALITRHLN